MKSFCQYCGKRRTLKTVFATFEGQQRQLDMCRPCNIALKFAISREKADLPEFPEETINVAAAA